MDAITTVARVGDPLPEIVLPRLDGGELALSSLRGKRLLLFFWGSW
jgi:peroxiredoxin